MEFLPYWFEIQRIFPEEIRSSFAKRARLERDYETVEMLANFESYCARSIHGYSRLEPGFRFGGNDPIS